MNTPVKFKKGQRVEFVMNKQSYLGTVEKGGAGKISVVVDGGKNSVSGPAQAFKPSNIPLPKDEPSLMDLYTVVSYKEHLDVSEETTCFSAKICLNGKPIMTVSNQGHGGPHEFWPTSLGLRSEMGKFFDNAKSWCEQFGYKDPHEPGDMWVDWYTQARPYGQTAKMYIGEFVEMIRPTKATA